MTAPKVLPAAALLSLARGLNKPLPAGVFVARRTIVIGEGTKDEPFPCAQQIIGAGRLPADPRVTGHTGGTVLLWDGDPGEPMFRVVGAGGPRFADLTLVGRVTPDAKNRAGPLVWLTATAESGQAMACFERVTFIDADAGVQFGEHAGDPCCSDSSFRDCGWTGCNAGFRSLNDQSVNHAFESPKMLACPVAWDVRRGGNVHVYGAPAVQLCQFLAQFGPGGENVMVSSFANVRFENDFRVRAGGGRRVYIDRPQMSGPMGRFEIDAPPGTVVIRDGENLPAQRVAVE